ncbi:MAG: hypothetical protein G01um10148_96 [Parcubacteria group bacterium Gr01-1014_8]|nr:MAG: hypothetical protein G01um10148_96 [Parcubacteria group bacterium Gr01-1014_8]
MEGGRPSSIVITAGLAAAILLSAIGWQLGGYWAKHHVVKKPIQFDRAPDETSKAPVIGSISNDWRDELARLGLVNTTTDAAVATSSDPLATFGDTIAQEFLTTYLSLKQYGSYSPEKAAQLGKALGSNAHVPTNFTLHASSELTLASDTSKERILKYRSEMRDALRMLVNGSPPEFETLALYIETKNPERLIELSEAAERYRDAEKNALAVVVPSDAAELHIRVVNALGAYGSAVDQLVRSMASPVTTLAVLRTYNEAEREMLYAFDALASYYVRKSSQ